MKALYIIWPDFEMIDKAIAAGIDTLLIANQNLYMREDEEQSYWGTYEDLIKVLCYYKNDLRVTKIIVPLIMPHWKPIPTINQRLFYKGSHYNFTPDPTSDYFKNRITDAYALAEIYSTENDQVEVVWDCEKYCKELSALDFTKNYDKPKYESDKSLGVDQWHSAITYNISTHKPLITGCLGNLNPWWVSLFKNVWQDSSVFVETTYPLYRNKDKKIAFWWNMVKQRCKLNLLQAKVKKNTGSNLKLYAGLWAERFETPKDFFKYANKIMEWKMFDGYWIYAQCRLSRYDKIGDDTIKKYKPYYRTNFGDSFFSQLLDFNYRIQVN